MSPSSLPLSKEQSTNLLFETKGKGLFFFLKRTGCRLGKGSLPQEGQKLYPFSYRAPSQLTGSLPLAFSQ